MADIIVKNIVSKSKYRNKNAVENLIKYILKAEKRKRLNIWGVQGVNSKDIDVIIERFILVKKIFHKENGVLMKHLVISFTDNPQISKKLCLKKIKKMIRSVVPNYQVVYAVHEDTDHIHIHLGINSIGFNGKCCNIDGNEIKRIRKKIIRIWKDV